MSGGIITIIVIFVIGFLIKYNSTALRQSDIDTIMNNANSLSQVVEKAQHLALLFKTNLGAKLDINNLQYFNYYLPYLDACVKSVSENDGVTYDDAIRTAVFIEAYKLKENPPESHEFSSENLREGEALLNEAITTEHGIKGAKDGKADADYSNDPSNPAPYFQRLMSHFGK